MKQITNKLCRAVFPAIFFAFLIAAGLMSANMTLAQTRAFKTVSETSGAVVPSVPPQYQIIDITPGVSGATASQAFGISTGGVATGRVITNSGSMNFSW